jgi:hypothetical protein
MMSTIQVERVLKQCEKVSDGYKDWHGPGEGMCGDEGPEYFDMCRNEGWIQALRLVLEVNGPVIIRNTELKDE